MHPFLNVSTLTDDEIIDRLGKAYTYLTRQTELGHNPTVQSIKEVIRSLEDERAGRLIKAIDEEVARRNPNSKAPIEIGKIEENNDQKG